MKDEVRSHLYDAREAGLAIRQFVADRTFDQYLADDLLRSAVERKFEIIGEALGRIKRDAPDVLAQIRQHRDVISFRNILIHGYDTIDDRIVWGVICEDLDVLIEDCDRLLTVV